MPRDEIVAFFERYAAVRSPGSRRGIYIVGAHFLRKRKSSLLVAVGEDAAIVTRRIAARLGW